MPQINETEINTPPESKFIADQNGTFIFSIGIMRVNSENLGLPVWYAVEQ